jgi:hypothetical protein
VQPVAVGRLQRLDRLLRQAQSASRNAHRARTARNRLRPCVRSTWAHLTRFPSHARKGPVWEVPFWKTWSQIATARNRARCVVGMCCGPSDRKMTIPARRLGAYDAGKAGGEAVIMPTENVPE